MKKKASKIFLDILTIVILLVMLFPIFWMVLTSLKSNNDILVGKLGFSRNSNAISRMIPSDDRFYFMTIDGFLGEYDWSKNQATKLRDKAGPGQSLSMNDHHLLVSSGKGIAILDPVTKQLKPGFDYKNVPWKIRRSGKSTTLAHVNGRFFFGRVLVKSDLEEDKKYALQDTYEGLMVLDETLKPIKTLTQKDYLLSSTIFDLQPFGNDLWIATDEGVNVLDTKTLQMSAYYTPEEGLLSGKVVALLPEKEVVWLATSAGLMKLDRKTDQLVALDLGADVKDIQLLFKYGNGLILGTANGLFLFNPDQNLASPILRDQKKFLDVQSLLVHDGKIVLGLSDGSLRQTDVTGQNLKTLYQVRKSSLDIRWENYIDMWENISFGTYFKNSLIICLATVVISLFLATMAGYSLARFRFPGSTLFSSTILAAQMIPMLMFLIPIYLMFIKFNNVTGIQLVGTFPGIIFVYSTFFLPMSIWILRSFFVSIPAEIEEAARIDGCSRFAVFWRMALPLAMPGIIATGIYIFLIAWDELMFATILLPQQSMLTIPLGIKLYIGNHQNRFDLMMAASVVATLPVLVLFFAVQKWFIKGLTAGAVKG